MKFFTMEWWRDSQQLVLEDPFPLYRNHIDGIRDSLPEGLLVLQECVSLHDSTLRSSKLNVASRTLSICLDGDDGQGGLRRFELIYTGVVSFETFADREGGLPGPDGYGDLGYDEVDVLESQAFEHCILFSTGIEFRTVFTGFELSWRDEEACK